ncbi:MAG: M14 metallopeptidase family protein [Bacteroidota bacterium]
MKAKIVLSVLSLIIVTVCSFGQNSDPFKIAGEIDSSVPTLEKTLGISIGDRPTRYFETVKYISALAESSPLVNIYEAGETHQGRKLYYLIISSEKNLANLDEIKKQTKMLSDPRITSDSEAKNIIENVPGVSLLMYSIHGNETSGTDASLQLAYYLTASKEEKVKKLLNEMVIIIYPMENPDGRERFLSQAEQWIGSVPNSDTQSFPHSGLWPSGRTNHYHFDLNRDWFILSQPESQSRAKLVLDWNPQLVVDAHEMGSYSTFLFNPPREPINPNMHTKIQEWWKVFAQDQAKTLDEFGWSYYTGEWLEDWFPGYGTSWPSYNGAVAILYEQARTSGTLVKRPEGNTLSFKQAVAHQYVSSIANLFTAHKNRAKLLSDFYSIKKEAASKSRKDGIEAFVIDASSNFTRAKKLVDLLQLQGVEVSYNKSEISLKNSVNYYGESSNAKLSKGYFVIPVKQPMQPLINAVMEFDTRMENSFLKWERESLEKGEGTKLYEVTAWSLPLAYGVNAYAVKSVPALENETPQLAVKSELTKSKYGYLIEYQDDSAIHALLKIFEYGIKVRSALKPFKIENKSYERGTLLLRNEENDSNLLETLTGISGQTGVEIIGVSTALSQQGADLGGGEFELLQKPKVALLTGQSIGMNNYGAIWFMLDKELGMQTTTLSYENLSRYDLRKYNVIIMPSTWGGTELIKQNMGAGGLKSLADWIKDGGTFIAMGNSAAFAADSSSKLSKVSLRRQSLAHLEDYSKEILRESGIKNITIDSLAIWESKDLSEVKTEKEDAKKSDSKKLTEEDKDALKFMPQGIILNAELNTEHWLNFGLGKNLPVFYDGNYVLLSKQPVQTAARFAAPAKLRLSGLLWPEAKNRIAQSAYLTRESNGRGQIILFAADPNFRAYFYGTGRLLLNSILLGPGMGASKAVEF